LATERIQQGRRLEYLAGGMTIENLLGGFPDLSTEDIQACFALAVDQNWRLTVAA
jgi:uncharacterized protein (DUF433 family)